MDVRPATVEDLESEKRAGDTRDTFDEPAALPVASLPAASGE
jgi:hypothetical protein